MVRLWIYISCSVLLLGACTAEGPRDPGKLTIVATTGMIGDAVKAITGDSAEVLTLMGPGVDPHLYKPTLRDVDKLAEADIIVCNGLHLEGKMADMLHKIGQRKKVIEVAAGIAGQELMVTNPEQVGEGGKTIYDPHIWFDVKLWKQGIEKAGREIASFDSSHKKSYSENLDFYLDELEKLDRWTAAQISRIPAESRILITAHDAFGYFGRAYGIEVMGLQGISTVTEPALSHISGLVDLLVQRKVKAVFVESSVSPKAINAVIQGCRQKGHTVSIGGILFSDAMGDEGTPEGTYTGMVRHNVNAIVNGLK